MKLTAKQVKEQLRIESVSVKGGVYTVRQGFYFQMGKTAANLENKVKQAFPNANIVDKGEVFKPFVGGQSVAQGSHWYVKFTLE